MEWNLGEMWSRVSAPLDNVKFKKHGELKL